ncbi:MAG: condensation domain-containing protein [Alphaproteobacteria bacterium]|nr:condensation domain-containing protein [Alphaproteobacteria bacterium]
MTVNPDEFMADEFKARHGYLPLSIQEEGYLAFCQKHHMKNPWTIWGEIRFRADPDHVVLFEQAINLVVQAHDILRTSFRYDGERWERAIADSMVYSLPCHDIKDLEDAEKAEILENFSKLNRLAAFPVYVAPLFRLNLIRVTGDEFVLFSTIEHLISDGLSSGFLLDQIFFIYQSLIDGETNNAPAKPYLTSVRRKNPQKPCLFQENPGLLCRSAPRNDVFAMRAKPEEAIQIRVFWGFLRRTQLNE